MKKWIPKILACIVMVPVLIIAIIVSIGWNAFLITDLIFRDIKRGYIKEILNIKRNDKKGKEVYK